MINFTKGNLLDAGTEALVNTVNTTGVMGKGIALMFKERFPENFRLYAAECKAKRVQVGKMFVTTVHELGGRRVIINFPTKEHWRAPSKISWIVSGLQDLRRLIVETDIKSIALPPLGAGNGGLDWNQVRPIIEAALGDLEVEILVYEPTKEYQNIAKSTGVEKLTPARALLAELIRRYWVLGMECSLLEVQKLAWFLERSIEMFSPKANPLNLQFVPHKYGPYANKLDHLLNSLDGSYLHSEKRISDAGPLDIVWFNEDRREYLQVYLKNEAKEYLPALDSVATIIDGFESPFGMELLATVDWLLFKEGVAPSVSSVRRGLMDWSNGGVAAGERKARLFDDRALGVALNRLVPGAVVCTRT